jgi:hypothetical protein
MSGRRALPALFLGSSVFLQFHLVLGLLLGPLAVRAFNQAKGPALAAVAVLAVATVLYWRRRRRKNAAPTAWMEATCPACLGVSLLAGRVPALDELTRTELGQARRGWSGELEERERPVPARGNEEVLPPGGGQEAL